MKIRNHFCSVRAVSGSQWIQITLLFLFCCSSGSLQGQCKLFDPLNKDKLVDPALFDTILKNDLYKLTASGDDKAAASKIDVELMDPKLKLKINQQLSKKEIRFSLAYGGFVKAKDFNKTDFKLNNLEYAVNVTFNYIPTKWALFRFCLEDKIDFDKKIEELNKKAFPDEKKKKAFMDSVKLDAPWNTKRYMWFSLTTELKQQYFDKYNEDIKILYEDQIKKTTANIYKVNLGFNLYHYINPKEKFKLLQWGGTKYLNVNMAYYYDNSVNLKETDGLKFVFKDTLASGSEYVKSEKLAYEEKHFQNIHTFEPSLNYYTMTINNRIGLRLNTGYKIAFTSAVTNNFYAGIGLFGSITDAFKKYAFLKKNVGIINYEFFLLVNNINEGGNLMDNIKPGFKLEFPFNKL